MASIHPLRSLLLTVAATLALQACDDRIGQSGPSVGSTGGVITPPGPGTITGGSTIFPAGATPASVTQAGVAAAGSFTCTQGALAYGAVTTAVGTHGVIGDSLAPLLNGLGLNIVSKVLSSVGVPDNAIDSNLDSFANFTLTAGLFGTVINTVDESVLLPAGVTVPAGKYAVFGVSFPSGVLNLALTNSVAVTTYAGGVVQESNVLSQNSLTLLGAGGSTPLTAFIGLKNTLPYDRVTISLTPDVATVDVGDAMRVYELCTDGTQG